MSFDAFDSCPGFGQGRRWLSKHCLLFPFLDLQTLTLSLGGDTGLIFVSRFSLRRTICVTLHLKWAPLSLEESL